MSNIFRIFVPYKNPVMTMDTATFSYFNVAEVELSYRNPVKPSQRAKITQKVVQAGALLDIRVLDHLIVTSEGFFSFADEGLL